MSRPTQEQLATLVEFLVQNPGIAKGHLRTAHAKQETKRKWEEISFPLNALGGAQKDSKGWAKYWADKKCALKKLCALHAQSMRRTGGGSAEDLPELTPTDQRLVAIMGGLQFATGDSHVAVNPFPSTSQSQNDIQLNIAIHSQDSNMGGDEMESQASPVQNVETVRVTSPPREFVPRRTRQASVSSVRSRTMLDQDRERFAEIERRRVEAETVTARALSQFVDQVEGLSAAIREGSQTVANAINIVANAINNVADALRQNTQ